jgi:hypothetical protein
MPTRSREAADISTFCLRKLPPRCVMLLASAARSQFQGGTMAYLPQEEICPISDQLLFSLYDAAKRGLPVRQHCKLAGAN